MQQVGRLAALGGGALLLLVVWKKAASTGRRSGSRGVVIAECSDCIVHSLQSAVMSLCRRAQPGRPGRGGGFSRDTGSGGVRRGRGERR